MSDRVAGYAFRTTLIPTNDSPRMGANGLRTQVEGFEFNDFCLRCQKVMPHKIILEGKELYGTCSSCGDSRVLTELNQEYYSKTDLWVTRFKVGNLPCVVAGKLLDHLRQAQQ